jgi:hypothetical protein
LASVDARHDDAAAAGTAPQAKGEDVDASGDEAGGADDEGDGDSGGRENEADRGMASDGVDEVRAAAWPRNERREPGDKSMR